MLPPVTNNIFPYKQFFTPIFQVFCVVENFGEDVRGQARLMLFKKGGEILWSAPQGDEGERSNSWPK